MGPDEPPNDPDIERLLGRLDHPVPDVTPAEIVRRAPRAGSRRLTRAAGVILGLAVARGAAYAAPGSPLPGWMAKAGRRLGLDVGGSGIRDSDILIAGRTRPASTSGRRTI